MSLAAFVYGPQGLSRKKVSGFLSQDDQLVAQLADYAEKHRKRKRCCRR